MNKKTAKKVSANRAYKSKTAPPVICPNCGDPGPHFVGPVTIGEYREAGYYTCTSKSLTGRLNQPDMPEIQQVPGGSFVRCKYCDRYACGHNEDTRRSGFLTVDASERKPRNGKN